MRPGSLISYPPRLWQVHILHASGKTHLVCRTCGPLDHSGRPHESLRADLLSHLAHHARCDVTPAHLRTCQCGKSGCRWHRRHRSCGGPVVLALTHRARSPSWQLFDTCLECCTAMASTAAVPEPPPQARPAPCRAISETHGGPPAGRPGARTAIHEDCDDSQVWEADDATS